ncbi:MAG: SDR family NAD(P)-dependent oxidoreductase, partial [Verrucomicrobia bacterium]|nr:SDR family NAD(P)-dependent oxidoreductase [Verrucomicrobiota bacterium]
MSNSGSQEPHPSVGDSAGQPAHPLDVRLRAAAELLEELETNPTLLASVTESDRRRLMIAVQKAASPGVRERRQFRKARQRHQKQQKLARDQAALNQSGIRQLRQKPVFTTPNALPPPTDEQADLPDPELRDVVEPQNCYICKTDYSTLHPFYDQLCHRCAEFNFRKRSEIADLKGRVALVTGGRVKIGYQAVIKLLRCGAKVIVSTRFPRDAAKRFAAETDFDSWADRLQIYGLDLRHTPSVEAFSRHLLSTETRLDFIVNNACQTVRRPPGFYQHMMSLETEGADTLTEGARKLLGGYEGLRRYRMLPEDSGGNAVAGAGLMAAAPGLVRSAELSQLPLLSSELEATPELFPEGRLDQDLQQVDLRDQNSWRMTLTDVPSVELLEVQLVNAVAPFILNARLKPLMLRTTSRDKHIVNVSAVEGQFYRKFKTTRHPHTNMAKAALNMMTRTSAADYHADGIHMNSVDTGWVTDEDPVQIADRKRKEHRFHPPL